MQTCVDELGWEDESGRSCESYLMDATMTQQIGHSLCYTNAHLVGSNNVKVNEACCASDAARSIAAVRAAVRV